VLPTDAKPDIEMNKAMMAKYRPDMSKFYLHKTPHYN